MQLTIIVLVDEVHSRLVANVSLVVTVTAVVELSSEPVTAAATKFSDSLVAKSDTKLTKLDGSISEANRHE